jgi:hypothetical protein
MTLRGCGSNGIRETNIEFMFNVGFSTNGNTEDNLNVNVSLVSFEYICQYNHCNDQLTENKMIKVANNHFNISSMYKVFKTKLQEKQTTEPNSGSISYSTISEAPRISTAAYKQTTPQPPNTSILHFISMNILILHILFLLFF